MISERPVLAKPRRALGNLADLPLPAALLSAIFMIRLSFRVTDEAKGFSRKVHNHGPAFRAAIGGRRHGR
jgi:hypothetical protein